MTTRLILTGTLLLILTTIETSGQKLKSGEWEVNITHWEETQMDFMGKPQTIYFGLVAVKRGKDRSGEYRFYLPALNGRLNHLTLRDLNDSILEPRLYYNIEEKSFTYNIRTETEAKELTVKSKNIKDIVLSGVLIWLRQRE